MLVEYCETGDLCPKNVKESTPRNAMAKYSTCKLNFMITREITKTTITTSRQIDRECNGYTQKHQ